MLGTGFFFLASSDTYAVPTPSNPYALYEDRAELPVSATAWGLYDARTNKLLSGHNTEAVLPIASITKLFTAYAVAATDSYDETVIINWHDLETHGRAGRFAHGDTFTLRELLFPLLLESSNDAGEAIARILGNRFAARVAQVADDISLDATTIADASGLSNNNVSSVADVASFVQHMHDAYPYVLDITRLSLYVGEDNGWRNNSPLYTSIGYQGGKHGFTSAAGRTFVGIFHMPDGAEVVLVLLGSSDLVRDARVLLGEEVVSVP